MSNQDWSHLGDEIKDAVQSAIDSKDFTRLNDAIGKTVNQALDQFEQVLDGNGGSGAGRNDRREHVNSVHGEDAFRDEQEGESGHTEWYNGGPGWYKGGGNSQKHFGQRQYSGRNRTDTGSAWKQMYGDVRDRTWDQYVKNTTGIDRKKTKDPFQMYGDRYASPVPSRVFGILSVIFGSIMAAGCGIAEFVMLLVSAAVFSGRLPFGMPLAMGIMVPFIIGGGLLAGCGRKKLGLIKRYKKYVAFLGDKEYCELQDLEYSAGMTHKKLLKDLRKMIDKEWFRQGHIDQQETSFIVTGKAYSQYLEAQKEFQRRQLETGKQELRAEKTEARETENTASAGAGLSAEVREVIDEGRSYLKQIKESNDAIPGEEISAKISRLELVIERIFNRVEQHPELVEELRRFMKYYLPTTVKLLAAYEELDRQEIQGSNILKSKKEIEDTLDTINKAFENLLDSFFEDTAVDISSDISVMQTLMAQEGLLGGSLKDRVKEKEKVLR